MIMDEMFEVDEYKQIMYCLIFDDFITFDLKFISNNALILICILLLFCIVLYYLSKQFI